jgi:hypothetical protein
MTITVHIQVAADSPGEIGNDLRQLLTSLTGYRGEPISQGVNGSVTGEQTSEPKQTAAQRKAAEKAAKEAAEQAAKEAAAAEAEKAPPTEGEKQDAKDEAADTAKSAPEPLKLTHDHVRKLLGGYVMAYGMENAQADGPTLLGVQKISEVPDTQQALAAAILSIANGIEKNPQKREMSGDGITKEKIDELKPFVDAAKAVK